MRKGGKEIMIYDILLLGIFLLFVGFIVKKILPGRGVGQMETEELHKEMKENKDNFQLIDVRQPEKYAQYHITGFRNIPLKYIRKQAKELDPEKKTIVVCRTGQQSNEACKRLKNRGIKDKIGRASCRERV